MEVVLPGTMTVIESHDVALALQHKIEMLSDVERAFVHVDHQGRDGLEHKVERQLVRKISSPVGRPGREEEREGEFGITLAAMSPLTPSVVHTTTTNTTSLSRSDVYASQTNKGRSSQSINNQTMGASILSRNSYMSTPNDDDDNIEVRYNLRINNENNEFHSNNNNKYAKSLRV
jgi:hypothetical protein